jgi:hypothetical protein
MNLLTRDPSAENLGQTAEDELRQIPYLNKEEEKITTAQINRGFQSGFDPVHCQEKVSDFPVPSRDVTNQTLGKIAYLYLQCTNRQKCLHCPNRPQCKKVSGFPVPSRDVNSSWPGIIKLFPSR